MVAVVEVLMQVLKLTLLVVLAGIEILILQKHLEEVVHQKLL